MSVRRGRWASRQVARANWPAFSDSASSRDQTRDRAGDLPAAGCADPALSRVGQSKLRVSALWLGSERSLVRIQSPRSPSGHGPRSCPQRPRRPAGAGRDLRPGRDPGPNCQSNSECTRASGPCRDPLPATGGARGTRTPARERLRPPQLAVGRDTSPLHAPHVGA
jgi:hypothetical protein